MAYATIEQFLRHLQLDNHTIPDDDLVDLQDVLDSAAAHIDEECARTFDVGGDATTRTFAVSGGYVFVDDIADPDDMTVVSAGMEVDFDWITPSHGRPVTMLSVAVELRRVQVTAVFGWPSMPPEQVVRANLILAHRLYKRADTPSGIGGFDTQGAAVRMPWRDPDVVKLLAPFRRVSVA